MFTSFISNKAIYILREYIRYRYKMFSYRSSKKNRYQNALAVCYATLDSVVSDIFGKSVTSVIDFLVEQSDSVIESIEEYQMFDSQKNRMNHAHIDYITSTINDINTTLDELVAPYENSIQLLCSIPGVKCDSALLSSLKSVSI